MIPRVIHPSDIKTRVIHVAGREWHYVCGVTATEKDGTFTFYKIERQHFYMYPEEALGPCVQSATIMWEHVESLFENRRQLMRKSAVHDRAPSLFHGQRDMACSCPWTYDDVPMGQYNEVLCVGVCAGMTSFALPT
jgi:hypothetical protein